MKRNFIIIEVRPGDIFLVDKATGKAIARRQSIDEVVKCLAKEMGCIIEIAEFPTDQLFRLLSDEK